MFHFAAGLTLGLLGGWAGGYVVGSLMTWWSIKYDWRLPWK